MEKKANTKYTISDILAKRWSPRSFADKMIETEKIQKLFEAARWSASSYNEQPWRFILGIKGKGETYDKIVESMVQFNKDWSILAPVLIVANAKHEYTHNNQSNDAAEYDTGQAVAHLSIQASADGLHLHQMGGFDKQKIKDLFNIPDGYTPQAIIAVGYIGDPKNLPEELAKAEYVERTRKDFDDIVFHEKFGNKTDLFN